MKLQSTVKKVLRLELKRERKYKHKEKFSSMASKFVILQEKENHYHPLSFFSYSVTYFIFLLRISQDALKLSLATISAIEEVINFQKMNILQQNKNFQ